VSCVADRSSAPASADRTRVQSDRGQAASNQDATTCLPKLSKIVVNRNCRFRPLRRSSGPFEQADRYLCRISPQVLCRTRFALSSTENVSGVACPCQPVPRFFFSSRFRRVFQRSETSQVLRDTHLVLWCSRWVADLHTRVEKRGLEPLTSCLQSRRSTS
jgi:hypothetical protein